MAATVMSSSAVDARVADWLDPPVDPYKGHPTKWLHDKLGFIWSKQVEIANSVRDNRHTAVHSCHGPGKSWEAAGIMAWWIDSHPLGEAFVVSTAPTQPQVEAILWRELGRIHRQVGLPGYITGGNQPQWKLQGGSLVGFGRKPADYTDVEHAKAAFQGIHERYVLIVIDEAAGIPVWLWDAVESLVTNEYARILAVGNPDDPASQFAKVCAPGSGWNVIGIDAFETPNFTGEEVPPRIAELLVSPIWVEERRKRWGEGSPMWESRVRGRFPKTATDTLISPDLILQAQLRDLSHTAFDSGRYGVDVARSGNDESAIYRVRGCTVRREFTKVGIGDTMTLAGEIHNRVEPHKGKVPAVIDVIGVGAGVFDRLSEQGLNVVSFNASEKADNPKKFVNRRAEQYWTLRELFQDGAVDLDPEDEELAAQLGSIKWKIDSAGRIQIESKEDMKKRGLPSPDRADAVMMAYFNGGDWGPTDDIPTGDARKLAKANHGITDDLLGRAM